MIAIIPARGGSKGLPKKNVRMLNGKPLIAYSIEAALRCSYIERVVVSTECENIAQTAIDFGAEVPALRPPSLAGDRAMLDSVINHMLSKLTHKKASISKHVVLLPTSPFRSRGLMERLCELVHIGHESVQTARKVHPGSRCLVEGDSALSPLGVASSPPCLRPYGIFGGVNSNGSKAPYVHVVSNPIMLIDIDNLREFKLAEHILQNGAFDFDGSSEQ